MTAREKIQNVIFILIGVMLMLLKKNYDGPYQEIINSYLGNLSISFSMYFLISLNHTIWKSKKIITFLVSLAIVELFEITDGFGIMSNVYDSYDLIANLIGISIALALDISIKRFSPKISRHLLTSNRSF